MAFVVSASKPQLWQLPQPQGVNPLEGLDLPLPLRAVLARRGKATVEEATLWLDPPTLPSTAHHFPDLQTAVERLTQACQQGESVAICGDYDADGMTSTALLIRAL
jgi:single-stranded-DNA-specific exonuclease